VPVEELPALPTSAYQKFRTSFTVDGEEPDDGVDLFREEVKVYN
jgi:hypothetical protein